MMTKSKEGGVADASARPFVLLAILIGGFLALCAATSMLPHDRYHRYQQLRSTEQFQTVWAHERIVYDPTSIDIALIGNSRVASAVSAPRLQRELSTRLGHDVSVANLAIPEEGRNAHFLLARELLARHPEVDLLILSAIEQMPRGGHVAFSSMGDVGDVVRAPVLVNRNYFSDLAFIPFRQLSLFIQSSAPGFFGLTEFDGGLYLGTDHDTTLTFTLPDGRVVDRENVLAADELRGPSQARVRSITPPLLPESARHQEFAIEAAYTQQIVDLARANGTEVAFLYLPIFGNGVPLGQEEFYTERGRLIQPDFLADRAELYSDYGHLNQDGAQLLTSWLGRRLIEDDLYRP